jgi:ferric-dicitrate binding protein FerR (iron transport regulator)
MKTQQDRADDIDREIAEPLRRARVTIDDIHVSRIGAGIEEALDRVGVEAAAPSDARPRRALRFTGFTAGIAAAAAAFVVGRHEWRPVVATPPPPAPLVAREPRLLAPYLYSGAGADEQTLDAASRLVVRAGARVRATIGTRVRLTLVGPGSVAVAPGADDGGIDLALQEGRLFVDYDGHGGGALRVRSPGALTTVVGTLFAVEAVADTTRVSVARGRVRTEAAGVDHTIVAGAAWSATDGAVDRMPADVAQALADHDASPPPPVGEYGLVRVDADSPGAAGRAPVPTLDGLALAAAPAVARVPAGQHVLGAAGGQLRLDVAGGSTVRVDRDAQLWKRRAPAAHRRVAAAEPATDGVEAAYLAAEAAMRGGGRDDARRALEAVVARDPGGARGEAALLDLARLDIAAGDAPAARRDLARLPDPARDSGLAEAAHHLRCRVAVKLGDDAEATACLRAFRRSYPRSPHDAESLALLASVTRACAAARPLLEEYRRVYPHGPFASDAGARLEACAAGREDR